MSNPTVNAPLPKDRADAAPEFSVIIAALDEADNIGAVLDEIEAVFSAVGSFEIVVVDDGSVDATAQVVTARQATSPNLTLVRHGRRRGKSAALGSGVAAAKGRFIVTMDADGQDDPAEALKLAEALRSAPAPSPMVAGIRRSRRDGRARLVATRLANRLRQSVLNDDCVDSGCGLKAFERELFLKFPMFEGLHRFLPAMAKAQGHPVLSVPIEQRPRLSGESKYTNLGRAAVGVFDLMGAAWLMSRARPERPIIQPSAANRNQLPAWAYLALTLFAALMFVPGQSSLPPMDRDESRYAQATTQMLETGEFVDIHYQDQVRHLQPAGIYWLQAASVSLFGDVAGHRIWAHRLPSLLSAIIAVLLTAWIGARAFGRTAGVLAALGMASCLLLGVEARMAKIDATLLAVTLGAQALLLRAYLDRMRLPTPAAALFWVLLGCGLMLKGPIILLVVVPTVLALSIWDRSGAWLGRLRPWLAFLTVLVVLPWIWAISVKTGGTFLSEALGHSLMGKVASGQQAHGQPPGYHLLMFGVMFWPTAVFAVLALPFAWAQRREPAVRFMIAWIVPTWLIFEAVATKLPHYVLPLYPALACLAAAAVVRPQIVAQRRWSKAVIGAVAVIVAALGLVLIGVVGAAAFIYQSTIAWAAVLFCALAAAIWLWVCWRLARGRRDALTVLGAAMAGLALLPMTFGGIAPSLQRLWVSRGVAQTYAHIKPCPTSQLASAPYAEPSMVYLVGTRTKLTDAEGAARHVLADPACAVALVGAPQATAFLNILSAAGRTPVAVGEVKGRNYSDGDELDLTFYRLPAQ